MSKQARIMMQAIAAVAMLTAGSSALAMEPLEVLSTADAHFVSGGVGLRERDALRDQADEYNLQLSFARKPDGAFLSYARVTLRGETLSEPIELTTAGPLLLGSVPPGSYTLSADVEGFQPVRRTIEVKKGTSERVFIALERIE